MPRSAYNLYISMVFAVSWVATVPAVSTAVVPRWFRGSWNEAGKMATGNITKRVVDSVRPTNREFFVWDSRLIGFGLRVQPSGAKSYVVKYRAGSGRGAPDPACHAGQGRSGHTG